MMRRRPVCVLLIAALSVFTGCKGPEGFPSPHGRPPVLEGVTLEHFTDAKKQNLRDFVLVVRISLITVQVPVGSVSNSEQLWSYLDEEPLGARIGSALAHNGVRVGLGRKGAWKDVAGILRRLTGQVIKPTVAITRPGIPVAITLKTRRPAQTIFTFRRDYTLFGRDYPPGDNIVMIAATIDYDDPASVHLTASPMVRTKRRRRKYVKQANGYAVTYEPTRYRLNGTDFRFRVPAGGFILIGPGREVSRKSSPGYHFLVHEMKGLEFETVVVIAPEVFAAPIKKKPG